MEKKLNLDKAKEILQLLQEDTLTPKQAKELVTLLVKLTEKQKQDLISKNEDFLSKVSQETFTLIQNALIEIKEKAHDNQLEVRQLTNKQKIAHESKMAQLEALIEEIKSIEIRNGIDGINGKDGSPDKPKEIADKLNTLEEVIDQKVIKGLTKKITDLSSNIVHSNAKLYTGTSETRIREIIAETPSSSGGLTQSQVLKLTLGA